MNYTTTYAQELRRAIAIAQAIAKENKNPYFAPAHLLSGLLHNEIGLATQLTIWGNDIHYLREWTEIKIEELQKVSTIPSNINGNEKVIATLEVAELIQMKLGGHILSPLATLIAICRPGIAFSKEQLKSFPLSEALLLEACLQPSINGSATPSSFKNDNLPIGNAQKFIGNYCISITQKIIEDGIDPVVGREKEMHQMMEVLCRRSKPNPMIIGEVGVGKTALVYGFAKKIVAGEVPIDFQNRSLFELNTSALIAGAAYKGEVEDRLKNIIQEIKQIGKSLLFIDDIHCLLNEKAGFGGAANLLKQALSKGDITLIGATTLKEYRKYIETDITFSRRFEKVLVEAPNENLAIQMVNSIREKLETYHGISMAETLVNEAVGLAKRYLTERCLPDSAIALLDQTFSFVKIGNHLSEAIERLNIEFSQMNGSHTTEDYLEFKNKLETQWNPTIIDDYNPNLNLEKIDTASIKEIVAHRLKERMQSKRPVKKIVEIEDLQWVLSQNTGIPLGKITTDEQDRLLTIEAHLSQRIVGQKEALKTISDAIVESRAGLKKAGLPIGSFFFTGPTGTGKTELAKSLAEFLFNDESALIRFDMSEFQESNSATLLYGASPGYVGYEEGGLLVNKIRAQPYSVLLFDEIEKSHSSVFDIFLQIMDDGRLTDKQGKIGDFSNAIILFTSNLGQEEIVRYFQQEKRLPSSNELKSYYRENHKVLRPEFLGRMDAIVPFAPITEAIAQKIFLILMKELHQSLATQGITLSLSKELITHLTQKGFHPEFGARPIRDVIRNELTKPLSRKIVAGEIGQGTAVLLDIQEENIHWQITNDSNSQEG